MCSLYESQFKSCYWYILQNFYCAKLRASHFLNTFLKLFFKKLFLKTIRTEHLKNIIKKYKLQRIKWKLIDKFCTQWISKTDGLNMFQEVFIYVLEALGYFSVNQEAQYLRDHISNFSFSGSLVITRKVFDFQFTKKKTTLYGKSIFF